MIFPFEIKFKKKLRGKITEYSTEEIINFIGKKFKESDADIIQISDNYVTVRNRIFTLNIKRGGSSNRWGGIYKAKYQIIYQNNIRKAIYSFDTLILLVIGIIFGLIAGFIGYKTGLKGHIFGLYVFLFLGVLSWFFKLIQHRIIFDRFFIDFISEKKGKSNS